MLCRVPSLFWVLILLLHPRASLALQPHGPPEGLYVHQMAHLLFVGALIFFIYTLHQEGLSKLKGFRLLAWACGLFILWNLDAGLGHWTEVLVSPGELLGPHDFSQRLLMTGLHSWLYYLAKMDHLILVPAFYLLYRSLKVLARRVEREER